MAEINFLKILNDLSFAFTSALEILPGRKLPNKSVGLSSLFKESGASPKISQ